MRVPFRILTDDEEKFRTTGTSASRSRTPSRRRRAEGDRRRSISRASWSQPPPGAAGRQRDCRLLGDLDLASFEVVSFAISKQH